MYICWGMQASVIGMFARERKREGEAERERASVGLSQWRWPGYRRFRGRWWPWRWGPGCGWCYSFCRGHVRPEGSSPGYPPLRAESHSPARHRHSVSPPTQTQSLATLSHHCACTLNQTFAAFKNSASVKLQDALCRKEVFWFSTSRWVWRGTNWSLLGNSQSLNT